MIYTAVTRDGQEVPVVLEDTPLGSGGEGNVYTVKSLNNRETDQFVGKIYHEEKLNKELENKVYAMLEMPPVDKNVAWALAVIKDGNNRFAGYLMRKLDLAGHREWSTFNNLSSRKKFSPDFDYKYAIVSIINLASILDNIHNAGHIVGDINESNIMVARNATVLIVDSDSAQVKGKDGVIYRCNVGKEEYTAPELIGKSFKDIDRTVATDMYAYAVASLQMLTAGVHPTAGKFTGQGDPPTTAEKIVGGIYPSLKMNSAGFEMLPRMPYNAIDPAVIKILQRALDSNPANRPSFQEVISVLQTAYQNLKQCSKVDSHWYNKNLGDACPWCARLENPLVMGVDTWGETVIPKIPKKANIQIQLDEVKFHSKPVVTRPKPSPVITQSPRPTQPAQTAYTPPTRPAQTPSAPYQPRRSYTPPAPAQTPPARPVYSAPSTPSTPRFNTPTTTVPSIDLLEGAQLYNATQSLSSDFSRTIKSFDGVSNMVDRRGNVVERLPLADVFEQDFGLGLRFLFNDFNKNVSITWGYREIPVITGGLVGLIVSLMGTISVISGLSLLVGGLPVIGVVLNMVLFSGMILSGVVGMTLFGSSIYSLIAIRKELGDNYYLYKNVGFWGNFFLMIKSSIFYGPLFVLSLPLLAILVSRRKV